MKIDRVNPLLKLLHLPSIMLVILGASGYFSDNASSQGPPRRTSDTGSTTDQTLKLINRTSGLEVAMAEPNNGRMRLTLKNTYDKAITAYAISTGKHTHSLHELPFDVLLKPGSIRNEDIGTSSQGNLTILAVVFDDRSYDGDATAAKEIYDYRVGKKIQYQRIIPLLNALFATRDDELESALEKTRVAISGLSSGSSEDPHFIIAGLSDAKQSILMDLEELKQQLRQLEDTSRIRSRIVRMSQLLTRYCQIF